MPEIQFHPDVALEIKASFEWYQTQAVGLGDDYLAELESAFEAIVELPETWPKLRGEFHRFLLSKFPFSVIYRSSNNTIYVVAVMHHHRQPGYWTRRG
jgi:toxin ParE1/3/4